MAFANSLLACMSRNELFTEEIAMKKRDMIEVATSLMGGLGIGAALMYLMDPQSGEDRRGRLADSAGHAVAGAEQAMSGAQAKVRHSAGHLTDTLGRAFSSVAERARHMRDDSGDGLGTYAGQAAMAARHTVDGMGRSMGRKLRRHMPESMKSPMERHAGLLGGSALVTVVGALALGAGIMYIMDPASGRRRRALVRDKASHYAHDATDTLSGKAHDLSNRAQGLYARGRRRLSDAMPGQTPHDSRGERPLGSVESQGERTMPSQVSGS
jgi:hypothetical protein